uniref:Uncharacterized protein n=1 Tax=Amazona collaria TaxID=241587 RepID=A0A8B9ITI9_9PSIT
MDSGWLRVKGQRASSLSITYTYVFWVAVSWAGRLAKAFVPQELLHAYKSSPDGFLFVCCPSV